VINIRRVRAPQSLHFDRDGTLDLNGSPNSIATMPAAMLGIIIGPRIGSPHGAFSTRMMRAMQE